MDVFRGLEFQWAKLMQFFFGGGSLFYITKKMNVFRGLEFQLAKLMQLIYSTSQSKCHRIFVHAI